MSKITVIENPYMVAKNALTRHLENLIAFSGMYVKIRAKAANFKSWVGSLSQGTPVVSIFGLISRLSRPCSSTREKYLCAMRESKFTMTILKMCPCKVTKFTKSTQVSDAKLPTSYFLESTRTATRTNLYRKSRTWRLGTRHPSTPRYILVQLHAPLLALRTRYPRFL